MYIKLLLFLTSLCLHSSVPYTQDIKFKITNIRNSNGNFVLCFFKDKNSFLNGNETIRKEISKNTMINNEVHFKINLPYGSYGLVLLDDENLNDEMDYGIMLPLEGFGFSNFVPFIRKPKFKDFNFEVPQKSNETIVVKIKYF